MIDMLPPPQALLIENNHTRAQKIRRDPHAISRPRCLLKDIKIMRNAYRRQANMICPYACELLIVGERYNSNSK